MTRRVHDPECDRFLNGACSCDGACITDEECSPLAAALLIAREDTRARAAAAEGAA